MSATVTPNLRQKLAELFAPWNSSAAPGLVIGIAHQGEVIFRQGLGLASVEHGTVNTPLTRMRIGSTSKHFASVAALLLAEEGKLDIDGPLRQIMPELTGILGEPTLRELMRHTSGLRDPHDICNILLHKSYSHISPVGTGIEIAQRFTSNNYPRGERMIYCNQGYYLLSLAVERASGLNFGEFLRQRIFEPMGMGDTCLLPSDMDMLPGIASLHVPKPDGSWRRGIYPSEDLLGSGGMVSTVDDMLVWIANLRGAQRKLGSDNLWQQMLERTQYSSGAIGDYCLGLTREQYRGVEIVHHAGAVVGGTCQMLTVPEHELDVILMFNRMDGPAPATALKVVDTVLAGILAPLPAAPSLEGREHLLTNWYNPQSHRLLRPFSHAVPGKEPVLAMMVQEMNGGLIEEQDGKWILTSPAHGTIEFNLPAEGDSPDQLEISDSGHSEIYLRLPEVVPKLEDLAAGLVGNYRLSELGVEMAIKFDGDGLYLDLQPASGRSRMMLQPLGMDVFKALYDCSAFISYPANGSVAIERKDGKVIGLWINCVRTRNLWLERCD